jgi:hypothetical protein
MNDGDAAGALFPVAYRGVVKNAILDLVRCRFPTVFLSAKNGYYDR